MDYPCCSPSRYLAHQLLLGQKVKVTGSKSVKGHRVAGMSYALYQMPSLNNRSHLIIGTETVNDKADTVVQ